MLDRDIINYCYVSAGSDQRLYCYNFELGFAHSVSETRLSEIFNEVLQRNGKMLPRPPLCEINRSDSSGRKYKIFLWVKNPHNIFELKPKIIDEVFRQWDAAKRGT